MSIFVKICGIVRREDALAAVAAGADAVGFVAWPHSRRHVTPEQVAGLSGVLPKGIRRVGVFVDPAMTEIAAYLAAGVEVVQLHGDEPPELARQVAALAEVWKAIRPRHPAEVDSFRGYPATRFLVDAAAPGAPGGTGTVADWQLARRAVATLGLPILLAGGLSPDNVAEAIAAVGPWGVDVSSGVESAPGRKDHARIHRFIAAARSVNLDPGANLTRHT
jgi:phosphoribosylanthranilate isomerase